MPQTRTSNTILLWLSETLLLCGCYVLALYLVGPDDFEFTLLYDAGLVRILLLVLVLQIGLWIQMSYSSPHSLSRTGLVVNLVLILGAAFLLQAIWFYFFDPAILVPRTVMVYGSLLVLPLLPLWRTIFLSLERHQRLQQKLLLTVGSSPALHRIEQLGNQADSSFTFTAVGEMDSSSAPATLARLEELVSATPPTHILIAANVPYARDFLDFQWSGLQVQEAAAFYESQYRRVPAAELKFADFVFRPVPQPGDVVWLTTLFSAAILGLLSLPVSLPLALAIRVSSQGSVLRRLPRRGWGRQPFQLYQFRIPMAAAAPPTASRLGRWMLRSGLYRIPELLNVLTGDLALLGPRPIHPAFADFLEQTLPAYQLRWATRPGILGWAQLNMAGQAVWDPAVELEYDLYYMKHRDMLMNIGILSHALKGVQEPGVFPG